MDFNDFDDEEDEKGFKYGERDGLIFLIDATKPMLQIDGDESPFQTSIACCKEYMLNRIHSDARDHIAIVLFGTDKSENALKAPHIVTLQELSEPNVEKLKQLEKILSSDDCDSFETKYGHSNDFSTSDMLWLCKTMYINSVRRLTTFRILLFTNVSDPHPQDVTKRHQACVRANDMRKDEISLELFPFGDKFDSSLYYKELIQIAANDPLREIEKPPGSFEELLKRVGGVNHKKRALCKVLFTLGDELVLAVNMYNLTQKSRKPRKVLLDGTTNERVISRKQYYNSETAAIVPKLKVMKSQTIGGKKILFSFGETQDVRCVVEPGMKLMGFKPSSCLRVEYQVGRPGFIYPEDSLIKGSSTIFVALLQRCAAHSVVPICFLTPRRLSKPKLVALVPQLEKIDENTGTQMSPPGFHVIYFPYSECFRDLELKSERRAAPEQIQAFRKVLKRMRIIYEPTLFDNPVIEVLKNNIEALALNYQIPRQFRDNTCSDPEERAKRLGNRIPALLDKLYPPGYDPHTKKKKTYSKRPAVSNESRAPKVQKLTDLNDEEVADLVSKGTVNKLTVSELKTLLGRKNVPSLSTKKKDELVNLVYSHYETT